jgi:hypothetical protein
MTAGFKITKDAVSGELIIHLPVNSILLLVFLI